MCPARHRFDMDFIFQPAKVLNSRSFRIVWQTMCNLLFPSGTRRLPRGSVNWWPRCESHGQHMSLQQILLLFVIGIPLNHWSMTPLLAQTELPVVSPSVSGDQWTAIDPALSEQVVRARQLETEGNFAEATRVWSEIESYLTGQFGSQSWQVTNAKLARAETELRSLMTPSQLDQLGQTKQFEQAAARALAEKDYPQAVAALQQMEQTIAAHFGEQYHAIAQVKFQIAQIHHQSENWQAAYKNYRDALLIFQRDYGPLHPHVEMVHFRLAKLMRDQGRWPQAIDYYRRSLELADKIYGPQHVDVATRANDLGTAHFENNELDLALTYLGRAAQIRSESLGEGSPAVGQSMLNLGLVYLQKTEYVSAEQHLSKAARIFQSELGHRHPLTLAAKTRWATSLVLAGKTEVAEQILVDIYRDKLARFGNRHVSTAKTAYQLAVTRARRGDYAQALPLISQALATQESELGLEHAETQKTVAAYVSMLERSGRQAEAANLKQSRLR